MNTRSGHLSDDQAQRLVDGALEPAEASPLESHADACPGCAALVESYRALTVALAGLSLPELPIDFTEGVLAEVGRREQAAAREHRTAAAIAGATLLALAAAVLAAGAGTWAPAAAQLVQDAGAAARALRFGADVIPPVVAAVRLPLAAASAALAAPLLLALFRLTRSPRTEAA